MFEILKKHECLMNQTEEKNSLNKLILRLITSISTGLEGLRCVQQSRSTKFNLIVSNEILMDYEAIFLKAFKELKLKRVFLI